LGERFARKLLWIRALARISEKRISSKVGNFRKFSEARLRPTESRYSLLKERPPLLGHALRAFAKSAQREPKNRHPEERIDE
jgi:hypothetical protein